MNRFTVIALSTLLVGNLSTFGKVNDELAIGASAPKTASKMTDVSGKSIALNDVKKVNGLVVIFSCNTCPYVIASESRYLKISELSRKNNVGMVLINSNEALHADVDSVGEMKEHAKKFQYDFPYTVDTSAALANAFGATRTPHVFLFDKDLKLVYRGAIDDSVMDAGKVEKEYLANAITALASGRPIEPNATKSIGCSIKRNK